MRLRFERLERRDLLARLGLDIEGPLVAFAGDEVAYVLTVSNSDATARSARVRASRILTDPQWSINGGTDAALDHVIEIDPRGSKALTLRGRVPDNVEWLFMEVTVEEGGTLPHTTVVLDPETDSAPIGADVAQHFMDDGGFLVLHDNDGGLHSAEPVGDVNGDGLDDAVLNYVTSAELGLEFIQHTLLGRAHQSGFVRLSRPDGDLLGMWPHVMPDMPAIFRNPNQPSDEGLYDVGDIDGDGFEDRVLGLPRDLANSGTARLLFGPDFRDSFIIFGSRWVGQSGADAVLGWYAGAVGDLNGDEFDDFYVMSELNYVNVFYGREFDRDLVGDIDRDGTVGLGDFVVLANHFGQDEATRAEGDLDGDGRVTFEDFVILSRTFGRAKTRIASATDD